MGRATDEAPATAGGRDDVWFVNRLSKQVVKMPLVGLDAEGFSVSYPLCGVYRVFFTKKHSGGRKVTEMRSDPPSLLKKFYVYEADLERLQERAHEAAAQAKKDRLRDRF